MKDYYYILGVKKDATQDEIRRAYKKLSIKFHPDKNDQDKFFEERFKDIQEAYDTLKDPTSRGAYDFDFTRFSSGRFTGKQYTKKEEPPEILVFTASKKDVIEGDIVSFTWSTKNADKVSLNCVKGLLPSHGRKSVKVSRIKNKASIDIVLHAENSKLRKVAKESLLLTNSDYVPLNVETKNQLDTPEILFFSANKEEAVHGDVITLSWSTKNADKITLSGIQEKIPLSGEKTIKIQNLKNKEYYQIKMTVWNTRSNMSLTKTIKIVNSAYPRENTVKSKKNDYVSFFIVAILTAISIAILGITYFDDSDNRRNVTNRKDKIEDEDEPYITNSYDEITYFSDGMSIHATQKIYWSECDDEYWHESRNCKNLRNCKIYLLDDYTAETWDLAWHNCQVTSSNNVNNSTKNVDQNKDVGWYEDDFYYKSRDNKSIRYIYPQYDLLQNYYDNFKLRHLVKNNSNYYSKTLLIHHGIELISKEDAIKRDFDDYMKNSIYSYEILVQYKEMVSEDYNEFSIVRAPLMYYVTKLDGKRNKFSVNISAVIDKNSSIIYAIDNDISLSKINEIIAEWNSKSKPSPNKNITLFHGQNPYEYCFDFENTCEYSCSQISVNASDSSDVIVLIKKNNKVFRSAYLKKGRNFVFNIPNGTYQPFFYYGDIWDNTKYMKETECGSLFGGFNDDESVAKDDPQYLNNNILTYTLIRQSNGNFNTKPSSLDEAM